MSDLQNQPQQLPQNTQSPPVIPEQALFKNRLQEYTQKASILLPSYRTSNEGSPHAPQFRSRVFVDGSEYVSPNTFSNRKAAEQDVARIALTKIYENAKDDIAPSIREDTIFCKSILIEYAVKMNLEKPLYTTEESKPLLPVFVSEVILNGVKYKGEMCKNKREAEQAAARAAILAILDSGSRTVVSELIKSKAKIFAAMSKEKGTSNVQSVTLPVAAVSTISADLNVPSNKRKEMETSNEIVTAANLPDGGGSGSSLVLSANNQLAVPFHEFKKPKVEPESEVVAPPIIFVPPVLAETVESLPCSTSTKRRNRKKKKNALVGAQGNPQLPIASTSASEVPPDPPVTQ